MQCDACEHWFQPDEASRGERRHKRNHNRTWVCEDCRAGKKTAKHADTYRCSRRGTQTGRRGFQKTDVARQLEASSLKCLECASGTTGGAQCKVISCKAFHEETALTEEEKNQREAFICKKCLQAGHAYGCCSRCYVVGPAETFQTINRARAKARGTLKCRDCYEGAKKGE